MFHPAAETNRSGPCSNTEAVADLNDAELISRCQQGDEDAFKSLVERYKNFVFALVSRGIGDPSRVEDVAQEAFLRVYRGLPYFRGEARLSTWLYRIVANLCAQERSRGGAIELSLDERDDEGRERIQPAAVDTTITDLEMRDRLEKAIARLPLTYRLLIAGHYFNGSRYEDLAEALDMPLGTVKTQLHRAKRELRRLLETELK